LNQITSLFKKLVNSGTSPDQPFGLQNRIRIFNICIFVIALLNLFYIAIGLYSQRQLYLNFLPLADIGALAIVFLILRAGKPMIALHLMMFCGMIYVFMMCMLFGEKAEFHVIYLFILIGSVVLDDKKYTIYYVLLAILLMVTAKFLYAHIQPIYPDAAIANTGVLNLSFTAIIIYLSTMRLKKELSKNHKKLAEKNIIIEKQRVKLVDSINYAKHIQQSILVEEADMQEIFPESFIYSQPKDIVSGDFYWVSEIKENGNSIYIVAVADCTGHGVPGAFLSMIGTMLLNKIVKEKHILHPALILKELHTGICDSLRLETNADASEDGMDIAICAINPATQTIEFAGAMNPLYVLSKPGGGQIEVINGDSKSIGGTVLERNLSPDVSFTNHTLPFEKDMVLYLFSDGYMDQFQAGQKLRFGSKQFKSILAESAHLPMQEQKEILVNTFNEWKKDSLQLDDVLVIGLKI
jgi:serine phosphatase RsbU (regulator of sigma subunit)